MKQYTIEEIRQKIKLNQNEFNHIKDFTSILILDEVDTKKLDSIDFIKIKEVASKFKTKCYLFGI